MGPSSSPNQVRLSNQALNVINHKHPSYPTIWEDYELFESSVLSESYIYVQIS